MALTQEQIEQLHYHGKIPDWAYYQQNGKSAQRNYEEQHLKSIIRYRQRETEQRRQAEEKALEADLEKKLDSVIETALDELLKDFR